MSTMGQRIRAAREEKGCLQGELAALIGVKSAGVISNWENDINKPDADKIVALCSALGVSVSYMLDYYGNVSRNLTPQEASLIRRYRQLDGEDRARLDERLNALLEDPKYKKVESSGEAKIS